MTPRALTMLIVLVIFVPLAARAADEVPAPLAVAKFTDGQEYQGTPYHFLGATELQLTIDLAPKRGHELALLWGAKNDTRSAILLVGGKQIPIKHGGYDGFKWLHVPLPSDLQANKYQMTLRGGTEGKPAFVAEIRLTGPGASPAGPAQLDRVPKIIVNAGGPWARGATAPGGEAFPDMRKLWDREPAPVANPLHLAQQELPWRRAEKNARQAAEALYRCNRFVHGWLAHADPKTGLIPRNLTASKDFWNGRDAAADNYPFMVLTCYFTDQKMFQGRMLDMLRTETRLTCRVDRLCDDYRFSTGTWVREKVNLDAVIFDSSEYVKDGLLPLTEWLGPSPWSERMIGLIDDVWKNAAIDTPFGKIPTKNFEVNGDLLQACSRLYWFTGDRKYLDWAIRLGDYYLLGDNHPTRTMDTFPLQDHGCEVTNGLSELYLACSYAAPEKRQAYKKPLHELYDAILKHGVNEHGQMWTSMKPRTGEHAKGITDNWGYNYDAIYTAYLLDKRDDYRAAVRKALENIKEHYTGHAWQGGSADGYADSIEGAINLLNREPIDSAFDWVDTEIKVMWSKQKPDGVIEGWHGDGNSARTSIMYVLMKTQGTWVQPWRPDVRLGAARPVPSAGLLRLSLAADQDWSGRIHFDKPRHRVNMKLPIDYPRINQFPEWFTVDADRQYTVRNLSAGQESTLPGKALLEGLPADLKAGTEQRLEIRPAK